MEEGDIRPPQAAPPSGRLVQPSPMGGDCSYTPTVEVYACRAPSLLEKGGVDWVVSPHARRGRGGAGSTLLATGVVRGQSRSCRHGA